MQNSLVTNNEPWIKPPVDIEVPDDYVKKIEKTLSDYRQWLAANEEYQNKADTADTEEEREKWAAKTTEHFKARFSGVIAKDQGERHSPSKILRIWEHFMRNDYRDFLQAHSNLTLKDILKIGIDKFIYTLGWNKPSDTGSWHNNKIRIGYCCHCKNQFVPLIFQHNHGLCMSCRPDYSVTAIRNFILMQIESSKRYNGAHYDLLMDFYLIFYHDEKFRSLFRNGAQTAMEFEKLPVKSLDSED